MDRSGVSAPIGAGLRAYLLASRALPLVGPAFLRRRLARGKEDAARWKEKLGEASLPRPEGPLIWLHAVGLGEVLALRGVIEAMAFQAPDVQFLVTSSARSSARVMAANLPARTQHQFLPLDAPRYLARFLEYWRPSLSVWAEQDVWPGAAVAAHSRGVPLAMINARITAESHVRRARARGLYRDVLVRFALVAAQDPDTATRLTDLGARDVRVEPPLKPAAPPLAVDAAELARLSEVLAGRRVWVAASTHPGDEAQAMAAAKDLPERLLVLVPRDTARAGAIAAELSARGLAFVQRSAGGMPGAKTRIWLADSYGELGLWYRLAEAALVGGGFDDIGGHNPWEAAALGAAVLHGPDVRNFRADYAVLAAGGAARQIGLGELAAALQDQALAAMPGRALQLVDQARGSLAGLADDLLQLAGQV